MEVVSGIVTYNLGLRFCLHPVVTSSCVQSEHVSWVCVSAQQGMLSL